jgi:hypothetical protein
MPQEAIVIRGRILARLLGLRLLTLDTNITTAPQSRLRLEPAEPGQQARPATRPRVALALAPSSGPGGGDADRPGDGARAYRVRTARAVPGSGVARARQLIEQCARALEEELGRP